MIHEAEAEDERDTDERCGRCGEPVPAGESVCPSCGALLDAYRTPVDTTPASSGVPAGAHDVAGQEQPAVQAPAPAAEPDEPEPDRIEPADAGATFDLDVVDESDVPAGTASPIEPQPAADLAEQATADVTPSPATVRRRSDERQTPRLSVRGRPVTREIEAPRPRRPGYVTRGTVEPVILLGMIWLVLAICLVAVASVVSGRGIAIAGFVLGAFGILGIVVAVLVALVRREQDVS